MLNKTQTAEVGPGDYSVDKEEVFPICKYRPSSMFASKTQRSTSAHVGKRGNKPSLFTMQKYNPNSVSNKAFVQKEPETVLSEDEDEDAIPGPGPGTYGDIY